MTSQKETVEKYLAAHGLSQKMQDALNVVLKTMPPDPVRALAETLLALGEATPQESTLAAIAESPEADATTTAADATTTAPSDEDWWPLRAEATRVYKLADADGSGCLDLSELADCLKRKDAPEWWRQDHAEERLRAMDVNGDGKVQLVEWLLWFKHKYELDEATCTKELELTESVIRFNKEPAAAADEAPAVADAAPEIA